MKAKTAEVKTAELKAKLSGYLRRVREEGANYVVLDRKTPIARLVPLEEDAEKSEEDKKWAELCGRMEKRGIQITPATARAHDGPQPEPSLAPDGRTDIQTIGLVRGGDRDY